MITDLSRDNESIRVVSSEFPTTAQRAVQLGQSVQLINRQRLIADPQFQFRLKALGGEIPGVHKSSW